MWCVATRQPMRQGLPAATKCHTTRFVSTCCDDRWLFQGNTCPDFCAGKEPCANNGYSSICLLHNDDHYHQECLPDSELALITQGDDYDGKIVAKCGCCDDDGKEVKGDGLDADYCADGFDFTSFEKGTKRGRGLGGKRKPANKRIGKRIL